MQDGSFLPKDRLHKTSYTLSIMAKRTRHYGVLASSCKGKKLNAARLALQMPTLSPQALESPQAFMARLVRIDVGLCPCCKVGRLRTAEVLAGARQLPALGTLVWPQERGGAMSDGLATDISRMFARCSCGWRDRGWA